MVREEGSEEWLGLKCRQEEPMAPKEGGCGGHGGARRRASTLTGNRGKEKGGEVGSELDEKEQFAGGVRRSSLAGH